MESYAGMAVCQAAVPRKGVEHWTCLAASCTRIYGSHRGLCPLALNLIMERETAHSSFFIWSATVAAGGEEDLDD
jgi:hypothetical protein